MVALFTGFAIEAVVVVIVVLIANLWKVHSYNILSDWLLSKLQMCVISSYSREGRRLWWMNKNYGKILSYIM